MGLLREGSLRGLQKISYLEGGKAGKKVCVCARAHLCPMRENRMEQTIPPLRYTHILTPPLSLLLSFPGKAGTLIVGYTPGRVTPLQQAEQDLVKG